MIDKLLKTFVAESAFSKTAVFMYGHVKNVMFMFVFCFVSFRFVCYCLFDFVGFVLLYGILGVLFFYQFCFQ